MKVQVQIPVPSSILDVTSICGTGSYTCALTGHKNASLYYSHSTAWLDCFTLLLARHLADVSCFTGVALQWCLSLTGCKPRTSPVLSNWLCLHPPKAHRTSEMMSRHKYVRLKTPLATVLKPLSSTVRCCPIIPWLIISKLIPVDIPYLVREEVWGSFGVQTIIYILLCNCSTVCNISYCWPCYNTTVSELNTIIPFKNIIIHIQCAPCQNTE